MRHQFGSVDRHRYSVTFAVDLHSTALLIYMNERKRKTNYVPWKLHHLIYCVEFRYGFFFRCGNIGINETMWTGPGLLTHIRFYINEKWMQVKFHRLRPQRVKWLRAQQKMSKTISPSAGNRQQQPKTHTHRSFVAEFIVYSVVLWKFPILHVDLSLLQ